MTQYEIIELLQQTNPRRWYDSKQITNLIGTTPQINVEKLPTPPKSLRIALKEYIELGITESSVTNEQAKDLLYEMYREYKKKK